ncbi:MAG: hypothetical protein R2769_08620 [Saprospiraceae bacterium]
MRSKKSLHTKDYFLFSGLNCGQSFMQLNWKKNAYQVQQFSYFESEGDASFSLNGAIWKMKFLRG